MGEGVNPVKRILTVFFLLDKSNSMADDGKIDRLNDAIPVTVDALKQILDDNPNMLIKVKVIAFSDKADFYVSGSGGEDVKSFNWKPLVPNGGTSTAQAIQLLCDQLSLEKMPKKGYPPVCVLVSDGYCTDPSKDYDAAIYRLDADPWGRKAARIVVSIGNDCDEISLKRFVNDRGQYINCTDAKQIVDNIKLVTTEATLSVNESRGKTSDAAETAKNKVEKRNPVVHTANPDEPF
jgi:uncharacterized protein YegL